MIRFVYIGDQIYSEGREFAFYDTVTDSFKCFEESNIFDSIEDLVDHLIPCYDAKDRNRFLNLIPEWYKNGDKPPWIHEE